MINVAIMGHGVVGSGTAEILIRHPERIAKAAHTEVNVKHILDLRDFDGLDYADKFTKSFDDILSDESVRVVAEVMGGINPAYDFVKRCLLAGKSVVTSNKELVAAHGAELLRLAAENGVNFLFEASVGGGIPVLRPISQCLAANEITEISGILNGTTNYILNKMIVDNMPFEAAHKLAQEKGFAEKNPAADIEGHDACRKICILSALAFGKHVYPEQVETEGITNITLDDVEYADGFGCTLKLIAHAKRLEGGKITATVRPTLVSREDILSDVNGVFNAIKIRGDQTGDVVFYGKGAGKEATASAVVADIIDCVKHLDNRKYVFWEDGEEGYVDNTADLPESYFVLLSSDDFDGMCSEINCLKAAAIVKNRYKGEIAMLTEPIILGKLKAELSALKNIRVLKILHTMHL